MHSKTTLNKKKIYQIALSSAAGIEPQKYETYHLRSEAEEKCKLYNKQNDNPWCTWVVIEKEVL